MEQIAASFYSDRVQQFSGQLRKVSGLIVILAIARLSAFLLFLFGLYLFFNQGLKIALVLAILFLILFFIFIRWFQSKSNQKRFLVALSELNQREAEAAQHRFEAFGDGKEFIDPDHNNSYDLDLFGSGSIFQYLNRTSTPQGARILAGWLKQPQLSALNIEKRQKLLAELAPMIEWRQTFSVNESLCNEDGDKINLQEFQKPFNSKFLFGRWSPVVMLVMIVLSLSALAYWIFYGQSGWFILATVAQALLWSFHLPTIKEVSIRMGKQLRALERLKSIFLSVENVDWMSEEAKEMLSLLMLHGKPSAQINRLSRLASAFDNRNNIFVGLILNLVFCWDIWCSFRFFRWFSQNKPHFQTWFETLAFFDAANSMANYSFNHPGFIYPNILSGDFKFHALGLGHPLIRPEKRVDNDFTIEGEGKVILVTGANMSGKSTFLRTIGVNMVLGMAGAPVCAREMNFTPIEIFSNMRNTDSLFDDESYFFAELKRLKQVLDELQSGHSMLVLLDEILKGTNSVDKLFGSRKLIEKLIGLKTPVIVATHDLKLTELESEFPGQVKNNCFEIEIIDDEMLFDYRLRTGVTHVMNATFLMKKMGIIDA